MYMKKNLRKSKQTKFWKRARAIWNLHSCYMFSAKQKRVIFYIYIIDPQIPSNEVFNSQWECLMKWRAGK